MAPYRRAATPAEPLICSARSQRGRGLSGSPPIAGTGRFPALAPRPARGGVFIHWTKRFERGLHMPLDGSVLGNCASEQMEALEQDYGDDEDVQVGAVMTIVEILKQQGDDQYSSNVRIRHNVGDPYRVLGILRAAEQNIIQSFGT